MTAERLIRLLQHPEQLASIPYEELKTLVLAYPYSHHLRQLLLLKSQQINHPETARNLTAAATHSLDRGLLFKRAMPQAVRQPLEVLELKPIETVLRDLEAIAPVERKEEAALTAAAAPTPPPQWPTTQEPTVTAPEKPSVATLEMDALQVPAEPETQASPEENTTVTAPPAPEAPTSEAITTEAAPVPFMDWVRQFNLPPIASETHRTATNRPAPAPPAPPKEKGLAQQLAERSVAEKEAVASETLARLLARQGHKEKAISMYERLILANPEKSATFAAAIEELKK